jgi:hypothetical protein
MDPGGGAPASTLAPDGGGAPLVGLASEEPDPPQAHAMAPRSTAAPE